MYTLPTPTEIYWKQGQKFGTALLRHMALGTHGDNFRTVFLQYILMIDI